MSFINRLPSIPYNFTIGSDHGEHVYVVPDITSRVSAFMDNITQDQFLDDVILEGHYTPESLSHELYGTTEYYWTILYINGISSMEQWPLTDEQLMDFVKKKYPGEVRDYQHGYNLYGKNFTIGSTSLTLVPVSDNIANQANYWKINIGDYIHTTAVYPSGTYVVGISGETLTLSHGSLVTTTSPTDEIQLMFYPRIPEYDGLKYWTDSQGVVSEQSHIQNTVSWENESGAGSEVASNLGETAIAVSHLSWEIEQNEKKRLIKVIKPEFISSFVTAIYKEMTR